MMNKNIWNVNQKNGMDIVITENINNGLINLKEGQQGIIQHCNSQTQAKIYFDNIGKYYDDSLSLNKLFNLDEFNSSFNSIDGLVLDLKRKHYAIKYDYSPEFNEKLTNVREIIDIPFFVEKEKYKQEVNTSFTRINGIMEKDYHYYLEDIIETCEEGFSEWVKNNVNWIDLSEEDAYYYEYDRVPDEKSNFELMKIKKNLELQFARATGVWYDFQGGMIWN